MIISLKNVKTGVFIISAIRKNRVYKNINPIILNIIKNTVYKAIVNSPATA